MSPRLEFALDTVYRAGRLTLAHFQTGTKVETKADSSPVTLADKESEELIRGEIESKFPGETVLGEEQGLKGASDDRWVVDPIDGTKSFVCGVPLYGTLLAYEIAGQPVLGVCYFPALDQMFYAELKSGAFMNGRAIRVSKKDSPKGAAFACGGWNSMVKHGRVAGFSKLTQQAMVARTWTDAYGHALVAAGHIEAMCDPKVSHWDLAAVSVIVKEAGGKFTDFTGRDGIFDEAVSSNGILHDTVLEAFRT